MQTTKKTEQHQEKKRKKNRYENKMSKVRQNVSYAEEYLVFYFAAMWVRASDANSVFCMGLFFYSLGFSPSHSGVIWYWTRPRPHTIKICINGLWMQMHYHGNKTKDRKGNTENYRTWHPILVHSIRILRMKMERAWIHCCLTFMCTIFSIYGWFFLLRENVAQPKSIFFWFRLELL